MWFGSAYYPEHWSEERWATDAPLMRAAGFNVVRIGEFAWCRMEPAEDQFDFAWIDRAVATLAAEGISVLIGTPTAGPPAWIVNAATPEQDSRQVYEDGVKWEFGGRSMQCVNHPYFRERSRRIAGALGTHFADNPAIMGYQLDNEIGMYGFRCYCPHCVRLFRDWLRAKYGEIQTLNARLGTIFGGGEFRTFDDIPLPRLRQEMHSPGLLLDSWRFFSDSNASYLAEQAEAIRQAGARQPITHNVCHMFNSWSDLDTTKLFDSLDVAGWDCYPSQFSSPPRSATMGLLHGVARAYKRAPYWMLEQQSGSPMHMAADDPRRARLWTWQSAAHGADMILYFRWRTCRFGAEQTWRGILDHDGAPNARYEVIRQTGQEMAGLSGLLDRLTRPARVAVLLDPETSASFPHFPPGSGFDYRGEAERWYDAAVKLGHPCDVVFHADDLSGYGTVVAPLLRLMDERLADGLRRFVEGGGTLLTTALTGSLDRDFVAPASLPPYLLEDVLGADRIEWSSLNGLSAPPKERQGDAASAWSGLNAIGEVPVTLEGGGLSGTYSCRVWCDHLRATTGTVLGRFAPGSPAAGLPAVVENGFGQGRAFTVAGVFDDRFVRDLVRALLGPGGPVTLPEGADVEVVRTVDGETPVVFVLNHDSESRTLELEGAWTDLLTESAVSGAVTLEPYDVRVLRG